MEEKAVGAQVALVDEKKVTPADVGNNFFLYKEDIGKTRAVVSVYIAFRLSRHNCSECSSR